MIAQGTPERDTPPFCPARQDIHFAPAFVAKAVEFAECLVRPSAGFRVGARAGRQGRHRRLPRGGVSLPRLSLEWRRASDYLLRRLCAVLDLMRLRARRSHPCTGASFTNHSSFGRAAMPLRARVLLCDGRAVLAVVCGPRFPTSQGRADWRRRRCGFSTGRPVEDTKMRVPWRDAPIVITRRSPLSLWFFASALIAVLAWTFALDDGHAYEVSPARSVEHLDLAHEAAAFLPCGTQATCSPVVVIVQSTSLMFVGPCQPARTRLCQDRRTHIHNHGQEPPPPRFSV